MESTSRTSTASGPPAASAPSKRDLIVNVFLRQEGHLSADDLVDLIRREDQRISRATVYRTLQWMVDAGIARKVDFGEGRFRFEHSYRHPRHFHLICKTCNQLVRVPQLGHRGAASRKWRRRATSRRARACCRSTAPAKPAGPGGRRRRPKAAPPSCCSRATRCASPSPPSAAACEFYTRAARITQGRARPHGVPEARRGGEGAPRHARGALHASCCSSDPQLESRPTFLFFKGAANGLFAAGAEQLAQGRRRSAGADDRHPLRARLAPVLQAIRRALRGLGRQADLPRVRRRGARAPRAADPRVPRPGPARAASRGRPRRVAPPRAAPAAKPGSTRA